MLGPGCPDRHFGRNQLSRVSLGFSPLTHAHPSECQLSIGIGPPPCFRRASAWRGLDRRASDRVPVTSRAFTRRATLVLRACRFRYAFPLRAVKLATGTHSLPRFSKRTLRPCNPRYVQLPCDSFLDAEPSGPQLTNSVVVSDSFHPACAVFFSVMSPY